MQALYIIMNIAFNECETLMRDVYHSAWCEMRSPLYDYSGIILPENIRKGGCNFDVKSHTEPFEMPRAPTVAHH